MFLVSILLLIIIIVIKVAVNFSLEMRLGNFSILVVCCFPIICEKVVLFILIKRFFSVIRCLTRMLIEPCSVMIMDKLPVFILIIRRSWTVLRAISVLVVTTHQKVISPHLCTHWLRILSRLEAILVHAIHSTTPLISLSHWHILLRCTTRNRYLI